jgi:glyoxylase-like metal-dependent hydrolase (beta-lactamase superfamily II)
MKTNKLRLIREIYPDIYKITLPIPVKIPGPINLYLFKGKNTTLLDTGILQTYGMLKRALGEIGMTFADIDNIIITHGHVDHYGAAMKIVKKSGGRAVIGAHEEEVTRLKDGLEVPSEIYEQFLRLVGVPILFRFMSSFIITVFNLLSDKCHVDYTIHNGDIIDLGNYQGKVICTPGHSPGLFCIFLEKERILFSADHIIAHITPNAYVILDQKSPIPVRVSQKEFYDSINTIEKLNPSVIYPSHGETVFNLNRVTEMYRQFFLMRQGLILSILDEGAMTVYQIARRLFPDIGGIKLPLEIFLSISEVYTHLQILMIEDRVSIRNDDGRLIFTRK